MFARVSLSKLEVYYQRVSQQWKVMLVRVSCAPSIINVIATQIFSQNFSAWADTSQVKVELETLSGANITWELTLSQTPES